MVIIFCCLAGIFGLSYHRVYGDSSYTLGAGSQAIVPGTKSGDAPIWPVTHPVFIVQFYEAPKEMGTGKNSYKNMAESIQTVIPYATDDAMWLCSNKLSSYLINKNFHTIEQVYIARKASLSKTGLQLSGGVKNPDTYERIKFLSKYEYKKFDPDINNGVFYNTILKSFVAANRNMALLLKDKDFLDCLKSPNALQIKHSYELWSYITQDGAEGSDEKGWKYDVDIKSRVDNFLHWAELSKAGLDVNNWDSTSIKATDTGGYTITVGDSFNLRYLDLLLTLNAISDNREYWKTGIKSFMQENKGASTLSITQGIVGRMDSLSVTGGDVKPATVFVSCNDLTQDAYNIKESYNLSILESSATDYKKADSPDYIKRLKAAVSLSESKSYHTDSIYSSALISRIMEERVRSVESNKLKWGSSNNTTNIIKLTKFNLGGKTWIGGNWVLEPPISSVAVNYEAYIKLDSSLYNEINSGKEIDYRIQESKVDLTNCYKDKKIRQQETVITGDNVNVRVYLNALSVQADKSSTTISASEWDTFIMKNNITEFKVLVKLKRDNGGTDFVSVPIDGRDFKQKRTSEEWSDSTDWEKITAEDLKELLKGKKPLGQWKDNTIDKMEIKDKEEKVANYTAKICIKYKAANKKWYYLTGKPEDTDQKLIESADSKIIPDIRLTNVVKIKYNWFKRVELNSYPTESWISKEPALAYAELKEGSIYNETFEAMAGVPSTRTLYFSSGGNEFMVDLQVDYEYDSTAIREYISHFHGTECEYKTNDQLKGGTGTYSLTETFVGDSTGKTISKTVTAESSNIKTATGSSTSNITVSGHGSSTTIWAEWVGSISNSTPEPSDIGSFYAGAPGSPDPGNAFDKGTQRKKADPSTTWNVDTYNAKLQQAIAWAAAMETTNSSYTVQKIADSDGQIRKYKVGDAVITVTMTGGSNGYANTVSPSFSKNGTYTSSSASGASVTSNERSVLGSGWGWTEGAFGYGTGYVAGCGHDCTKQWDVEPKPASGTPGEPGYQPAVTGVPHVHTHQHGSFVSGRDITQGASATIDYTIRVTFKNGILTSENYDGNSSDISKSDKAGLTYIPAHALCGPCCAHDLPAVEDVWYQDTTYDTIQITKSNVYKIQNGYVTEMTEITYDSDDNLIASITQGDPNIFYNIAANNNPTYQEDKLTNASKIGRIRYSLQEAQGDKVYYEEMSSGVEKRTNKCDGLSIVQSPQNPAPLAKKGHELGYASGILYSNGKTAGYGNAGGLNITTDDFVSDNKPTISTPKNAYGNKLDSKDLLTEEWKRFYTRRTQMVTATVISDMLILQTSSGDQSPVYFTETTTAQAQKDFPSLRASGDVEKDSTQDQIDAKWDKMWTKNGTTFAKTKTDAINIGSYNGKYNLTTTKYKGTGANEKILTRFDDDYKIFTSPKDELGLANVKSNQSFTKPAYGSSNISSPGKAQLRMDRVSDLLIFVDKVKQKPTNENAQYETGQSFIFYIPVLKYNISNQAPAGGGGEKIEDAFTEAESEVLSGAGLKYGKGLIYESKYSSYDDNLEEKVNNIVTLNAVSTQNAMVIKSDVEDQRTQEGIVKDAMETLKAMEKCPGTPELCEYRYLSCKYTLDTTSISFAFEDEITEIDDSLEEDLYSPFKGQLIANNIKNSDGAFASYELPNGVELITGDSTYGGFGTGQFLKVTGSGTSLQFPYNDCKVNRISSSRVKISADIYIDKRPSANTMLFSIGGVGLYVPANGNSPVFITSSGQTRAGITTDIIGKKVKIAATFSLGSLYDCELDINGVNVIPRVTTGLTDSQIVAAAIDDDMVGSGVNIGSWEYNSVYATNFYMDNVVIIRCGGTLEHTASCYTTFKKEKSFYQDTFNGITSVNNKIDWTRAYDDGKSYGVITNYSKHVHNASCLSKDSIGYQIAIAEAKEGDLTSLQRELGTTLFNMVVNKFGIESQSSGNVKAGQVLNYDYTGNVQTISLPKGTYKLEAYGAQGGDSGQTGGNGGYAAGTLTLSKKTTLYIQVGGKGANNVSGTGGGYNGGGNAGTTGLSGGGGGATSIATSGGTLSSVLQNSSTKNDVILVAGGGGGAGNNQTSGGSTGTWYHTSGCTYEGETHTTTSASSCSTCGHSCGYFVGWNTTTYYVGAGGTGGGISGGNGGTNYNVTYNGMGGSSGSYSALGQGQVLSGGGGGGGYYGGFAAKVNAGGGGGSGYVSTQLSGTSQSNGARAGNGRVVLTVIDAYSFPDETELFNYIKDNMSLIPDYVTTSGKTIVNPIWKCKLINNTEKVYIEETLLTCTEPHHSGGHYDYANDICWSACGNDANHKTTHEETVNANGTKIQQAEYITLDNFFKVYFPNTGDFYGDGSYGIPEPKINRGKGYIQNMDTTEWTREKYVKFDYEVLYERNGVWESHSAGEWIPLEIIDGKTTRIYMLSGGTTLNLQGGTYEFDIGKQLMRYNGGSTTLLEGGTMAVMNGLIFEWNGDGTVSVSTPYQDYNFYCLLSNNEVSCVEVQYAAEAINYDEQSTDAAPYSGDGRYKSEFNIYTYGNVYNTNKQRFSNFTANHTAGKLAYIDIVGRIGNFIIEDTDDMRFSNFFKKPVVETNDDWYIEGIISRVDSTISENYLSWHRNSAGYPLAVDVRGEQVSKLNGYYNTWGTQEWTTKANSESMGVSADKNADSILQRQQLKLGYNVLFDITTLGNYNQYLQVIPYFYALNTKTDELVPVDVYINNDGNAEPINYFGLYSEYMDDKGNYLPGYEDLSKNLYRYNMYLNWTDEAARRNYTAGGLESKVSDSVRDYFTEGIYDSDGEITGYKYLTVPYGNFYNLGTMQCLQPGRRARTFLGNSRVTAIIQQSARLGITGNGINGDIETNLGHNYLSEMFYKQAQRWHLTMGLPSSAIFTAYRENGIHVTPEEDWYVASYIQGDITLTKHFSKTFLKKNVGEKEYALGSTFTLSGIQYKITEKYNAGNEFNNNNDYVILMTADMKAIGDVWNLKYKTGEDNGNITLNGKMYHFGSNIPTFIAAYDTVSSLVDISTQQTH